MRFNHVTIYVQWTGEEVRVASVQTLLADGQNGLTAEENVFLMTKEVATPLNYPAVFYRKDSLYGSKLRAFVVEQGYDLPINSKNKPHVRRAVASKSSSEWLFPSAGVLVGAVTDLVHFVSMQLHLLTGP